MLNLKTHFEQIPLEAVMKIAEIQRREMIEENAGKEEKLEETSFTAPTVNGKGEKS